MNDCILTFLQVNLAGLPYGLSFQETDDLWAQADVDGNGVVNYEEFKVHAYFLSKLLIISFVCQ